MQLLVSVSNAQEARWLLAAGIPLIDLKDTSYGALAVLDAQQSQAIIQEVNRYRVEHHGAAVLLSATVGDGCTSIDALRSLIDSRLAWGVDIIKLPATMWADIHLQSLLQSYLQRGVRLIAVLQPEALQAPSPTVVATLAHLSGQGYFGVMVDTIEKSQPLTALLSTGQLRHFVSAARASRLFVGLAGGLQLADVAHLVNIAPDYLGFRSGLCEHRQRHLPLMPARISELLRKVV